MSDEVYMRLAIQKAWEGIEEGQTPFGACLVREGAVVSCAHNRVWSLGDITAHAEVQAIRDACTKLRTVNLAGYDIRRLGSDSNEKKRDHQNLSWKSKT